jgi:alpha-beta hydrolase superfamily lysophospholipase
MKIQKFQAFLFAALCSLERIFRRRWLCRLVVLVLVAALAVGALMVHKLGETLLVPPRRVPGDWQNVVLEDPARHGVVMERFSTFAEDGVGIQALLVRPAALVGESMRYREMQRRLGEAALFAPLNDEARVDAPGDAPAVARRGDRCATVRATVLLLHGRSGIKEDGVTIAERFAAAGLATVLYDSRGHGQSPAPFASYGKREVADLQQVMNALQSQYGGRGDAGAVPLLVFGNSMGAAVTLQALPKDTRLRAAVVVSPFADLSELTGEMLRRRIPAMLRPGTVAIRSAVSLYARGRAGFLLGDITPEKSAAAISVPTMVVHGEQDTMIPPNHGRRVFAAIDDDRKVWRLVAGARHGNVLMQGGDDLYEQIVRFYLAALENDVQEVERLPGGVGHVRLAAGRGYEN